MLDTPHHDDVLYYNYYSFHLDPFDKTIPLIAIDRNGKILQDNNKNSLRILVALYNSKEYKDFIRAEKT